jgi:hypothetical protein
VKKAINPSIVQETPTGNAKTFKRYLKKFFIFTEIQKVKYI